MTDQELMHYGILGMKWGVRRTDAQLARAKGNSNSDDSSSDYKRTHSKSTSSMTDKELQDAVNRLRNEKAYAELNPVPLSRGQKFMNYIKKKGASLSDKIVDAAIDAGVGVGKAKLKQIMEEKIGLRDAELEALKVENNKSAFRKSIAKNNVDHRELTDKLKKGSGSDTETKEEK